MCLILFAFQQHTDIPLMILANRDEYYARPTQHAHWWQGKGIFAGRDLVSNGTWLGVNRQGYFATVTNIREPTHFSSRKNSRGELVQNFLLSKQTAVVYLQHLISYDQNYAGFNLLLGNSDNLWFYSNRERDIRPIKSGIYGISNGHFDEPWPKVVTGKLELTRLLSDKTDEKKMLAVLNDKKIAEDYKLPNTGVSLQIERLLSSRFVSTPVYGTRACTMVTINDRKQVIFNEQSYTNSGINSGLIQERFNII